MKNPENNHELNKDRLDMLKESFQAALGQQDLFANIIDFFPYPIEVFTRDGTTVMVNRALLDEFGIPSRDMIIGKYNIFKDPEVEKTGLLSIAKEIFEGKGPYTVTDIKAPIEAIRERYHSGSTDIDAMYQDITGFPIFDGEGTVSHVVIMFITRRIYKGKVSIAKAAEYIENHWDREFDLNETAKAAGLSLYHFSRVFKSNMGMTPKSYYIKIKIEHLMKKLRDLDFTVKEAFDACGMTYTGQSFAVFKKHVGVTPGEYREKTKK